MPNNPSKQFKKFKKKPLFVAFGVLALAVFSFWWVLNSIKSTEAESENAQAEWQAENTRREAIRSLERSIKDIEDERVALESHFAQSENVVPFLDTLESLAQQAGGEAKVTAVDIPKDKEELVVSLRVEGSFQSNYKFIKLLENSPYELEIESFDLSTGVSSEGAAIESSLWEGRFTLRLISFVK